MLDVVPFAANNSPVVSPPIRETAASPTFRADNNSKVGPWMDGVSVLSVFPAKVDEKRDSEKWKRRSRLHSVDP